MLLYKRLKKLSVIRDSELASLLFLKPVLDYYESICKKATTDIKAAASLKKLVAIVPTLKQIKTGMKHRQSKEHIVYKIVLDVLAHYLKEFDHISAKVSIYRV